MALESRKNPSWFLLLILVGLPKLSRILQTRDGRVRGWEPTVRSERKNGETLLSYNCQLIHSPPVVCTVKLFFCSICRDLIFYNCGNFAAWYRVFNNVYCSRLFKNSFINCAADSVDVRYFFTWICETSCWLGTVSCLAFNNKVIELHSFRVARRISSVLSISEKRWVFLLVARVSQYLC